MVEFGWYQVFTNTTDGFHTAKRSFELDTKILIKRPEFSPLS